ncbi:hypothetical protein [Lacticaseibacillus camelliae]|uniref:Uncharacterized protein n=1 Tax=Lacticaseibacillus camelliae DSM 22697 = JCM 13995 TaxID=1423730 RepID=A0A0R2EQY6_9LACO|nr:hypothetical protein [Lacticaseibacillus camelliae]KRN18719.1 hypothetical protein FC75_GL000487 [Lacticaseibacillus camelliae DSM 22697 = JCM 13995]
MFDERQRLLRLRGFAGGFWLLLGLLGLNFAVSAVVGHPVVADQGTLTMLVFFPTMVAVIIYDIFTGAYLKPSDHNRILLVLGIIGIMDLLIKGQDYWWKMTMHYGAPLIVHWQVTRDAAVELVPWCMILLGMASLIAWWRGRRERVN